GPVDQDLRSVAMRCYSHLSDDEREQIGLAKAVGHSIRAIAQAIGRPKSTISRELSRNRLPSGRYSPLHAAGAYQLRRRRDAAGKDSTIKHVMSGVNPQGCQVFSFKQPSPEDLDHDFFWRYAKRLPERGRIGIFNRSYYEEVLVVRVHDHILKLQKLPPQLLSK